MKMTKKIYFTNKMENKHKKKLMEMNKKMPNYAFYFICDSRGEKRAFMMLSSSKKAE